MTSTTTTDKQHQTAIADSALSVAKQAQRTLGDAKTLLDDTRRELAEVPSLGRLWRLGALLVGLGSAALLLAIIFEKYLSAVAPAVAAASIVWCLLGLALAMPSLLTDGSKQYSAMRVALFAVILVFALLTVKAGWTAKSLADLKIDITWAGVLATALGGKAIQSFAERTSSGAVSNTGERVIRQ